jgi:hypothetical protein
MKIKALAKYLNITKEDTWIVHNHKNRSLLVTREIPIKPQ